MAGTKARDATKAATAPAKVPAGGPQSISDAIRHVEKTKTAPETLEAIADLYDHFLSVQHPRKIVDALDTLHSARFLELHAWRVRGAALDAKTRHAWLLTVVLLVGHGQRRAKDATATWACIQEDVGAWRAFIVALCDASRADWTLREKAALVQFFIYCFSSLDVECVARESVSLVSLAMWATALAPVQRALEFADHPRLLRLWNKLIDFDGDKPVTTPPKKKRKTEAPAKPVVSQREKAFFVDLLVEFTTLLREKKPLSNRADQADDALRYVALTLTLLCDLLSQVPTRRFLEVVVRRKHVLALTRQSPFMRECLESRSAVEAAGLSSQIDRLEQLLHFPIDTSTGKSLTTLQERKEATSKKIQKLQLAAFSEKYRDTAVETLAIVPVAAIVERVLFKEQLEAIADQDRQLLESFGVTLAVFADPEEAQALAVETLVECFVEEYASPKSSSLSDVHRVSLPTELDIWHESLEDTENHDPKELSPVYGIGPSVLFPVLPLPKLGLQYLNLTDFLERNAALSRIEAAKAVRRDLESAIRPLDAVRSLARNGETVFRGFSQMAAPLQTAFSIMKVEKPAIGETFPASVVGEFDIELDTRHDIMAFDRYQHNEVVYLVTIRPTIDEASEAMGFSNESADASGHFAEDHGVLYVRCAKLTEVLDESGKSIKYTDQDAGSRGKGRKRTLTVALDGAQYRKDLEDGQLGSYEYVNLLVRRDPRTNNFTAVVDTITSMLHSSSRDTPGAAVPSWLYDLFLGYGDPSSASYEEIAKSKLQAKVSIPLHHAFRDTSHAVECCSVDSKHHTHLVDQADKALAPKDATGPFTLVTDVAAKTLVLKAHKKTSGADGDVAMETPRLNKEQGQLVIRGTAEGLTLATGANGSGQSEALAQLVQNLYQSTDKDEKILLVARSTTVLDMLLSQIKALPLVDEGGIVRLGGGRSETDSDDFSCQGRVDLLLQRRIDLLNEVDIMAKWMERTDAKKYAGISGSASYSCENALFFYRFHMKALFDEAKLATSTKDALFSKYHTERLGSEVGSPCELHAFAARMEGIYGELHRLQAYELLQLPAQRRDIFLMQHARVIAMTSRHSALQFSKLTEMKLKWTSLIVDDASQINELDTFIPLALATSHNVKRVILVGDPMQQPTVDSAALKQYACFHSSLFSRLLRLGVPHITLSSLVTKTRPEPPKHKPTPPPEPTPTEPTPAEPTPTKKTPTKKTPTKNTSTKKTPTKKTPTKKTPAKK